MSNTQQDVPFGALFADEPSDGQVPDPQYSAETQVSASASDLGTDTYLKWTEDSDA